MEKAIAVVYFEDLLEETAAPQFGILFEDGFVVCLCCGGSFEKGDYNILQRYSLEAVNEVLKNTEI